MKKTNLLKRHVKKSPLSVVVSLLFLFLLMNDGFASASQPFYDSGQKYVKGTVTEANGTPLPGVAVFQKTKLQTGR
ncbi:MAG: hypothetical protein R2764_25635 [Bacteroidales bacterium]